MRRSSLILTSFICMVAVAACVTDARAGGCTTVSNIYTYTHTPPLDQTNWSDPLITIPKFNPADGTLCLVVVRQNATLQVSFTATNTSPVSPANLSFTISDTVTITPPAGPVTPQTHNYTFGPQNVLVAAGGSTGHNFGPAPYDNEQTFTSPGDLGAFIGADQDMNFSAAGNGSFNFSTNSGNANVIGTVSAGAHIEVIYYVPEPASLAMLAVGTYFITRRSRKVR